MDSKGYPRQATSADRPARFAPGGGLREKRCCCDTRVSAKSTLSLYDFGSTGNDRASRRRCGDSWAAPFWLRRLVPVEDNLPWQAADVREKVACGTAMQRQFMKDLGVRRRQPSGCLVDASIWQLAKVD